MEILAVKEFQWKNYRWELLVIGNKQVMDFDL